MPEGPEVRTIADELHTKFVGSTLFTVDIAPKAHVIGDIHLPAKVNSIYTYGKRLIIDVGDLMIASLVIEGRFFYVPSTHTIVSFHFDNGSLYFDDFQNRSNIKVIPATERTSFFAFYGPDVLQASLTNPIDLESWLSIFSKRKIARWAICKALITQEVVAGIGNYLMSEILYLAGVHPNRVLNTITRDEHDAIRLAAHKVIAEAYAAGGHTLATYITPSGQIGKYRPRVYGRTTDPYGHAVICQKTKHGRKSHWVAELQK